MKIAVYMNCGRRIHILDCRSDLIELLTRNLGEIDTHGPIGCVTQHHRDGNFEPNRLLYLRAHSIAEVVPVSVTAESATVRKAA